MKQLRKRLYDTIITFLCACAVVYALIALFVWKSLRSDRVWIQADRFVRWLDVQLDQIEVKS